MTYDIFISYKHKTLATVNNLYYKLATRGYSTFFDLDEMKKDNFDVQLLHYIESSKDVFVILEEGFLGTSSYRKSHTWRSHGTRSSLVKNDKYPLLASYRRSLGVCCTWWESVARRNELPCNPKVCF